MAVPKADSTVEMMAVVWDPMRVDWKVVMMVEKMADLMVERMAG